MSATIVILGATGDLTARYLLPAIAQLAVDHGWAGLVINGAVRDSVALGALPLGIKALGTNPRKSAKNGDGQVDQVVQFGGVTFAPGEYLVSDQDGIVVLAEPPAE